MSTRSRTDARLASQHSIHPRIYGVQSSPLDKILIRCRVFKTDEDEAFIGLLTKNAAVRSEVEILVLLVIVIKRLEDLFDSPYGLVEPSIAKALGGKTLGSGHGRSSRWVKTRTGSLEDQVSSASLI